MWNMSHAPDSVDTMQTFTGMVILSAFDTLQCNLHRHVVLQTTLAFVLLLGWLHVSMTMWWC